jgi:hypothetical protein
VACAVLGMAAPVAATTAATPWGDCSCDAAASPAAFRSCVRAALRDLDADARRAPAVRTLKRLVRRAACGRATTSPRSVACCLPYTADQAVVRERMCATVRAGTCTGLGGNALAAGTACDPDPCGWSAADIPVAHTPAGGYGTAFPAPILAGCTEPLVAGAPDLRGMWKAVDVQIGGAPAPADHPAWRHFQRVEQCGERLVVTAGGVVHDMRCDGTVEHGVHDVFEGDHTTPITVVATYEEGVHVLRPVGLPVEVTRQRDGDDMVWRYLGVTVRLTRVGGPEALPPWP